LTSRNALIGTIFGNRSPLPRKKHYLPTSTPHTTPIGSPRPRTSYDNDDVSSKRRGSVASPRLGDKLKSFLNVRRGSCIEGQIKSSLSISYEDDNNSPYFVPISPSKSPFVSPSKYNQRKSEFRILEDLEELDLEDEDSITFVSSERIEYKSDISFDESLARMVEKMSFEGYSEEQINAQLQKEREKSQVDKDPFRPNAPIPSSWHSRIIESINRSLRFDSPHHLLSGDESKQTPKNIIDSLPTEVFSEKFSKDDHCTICLSSYTEGEQMKSLPCLHCFHTDCLDQWFKVSCSCPTCKDSSI